MEQPPLPLRLSTIVGEFWRRRNELLEIAETDWRRLERDDWLRWNLVKPKIEQRLSTIESGLDQLIDKRALQVM